MQTRLEIYNKTYLQVKSHYIKNGATEDRASRLANIYAVKNTNAIYNEQRTPNE